MTWVLPVLLWGLLGLTIPVFIHLWNDSKRKVLDWAAFQWLNNQESESSRSFKLENWILLLIRLLFLTTLVFLLAGMIWEGINYTRPIHVLHLVWPDKQIEEEFRFELDQANKKGQQIHYLGPGLPDYIKEQRLSIDFSPNRLQDYFDELLDDDLDFDSIYLYTGLMDSFFPESRYWLPQSPVIRAAKNYSQLSSNPAISLTSGEFLTLDKSGILVKTKIQNYPGKPIPGEFSYGFENLTEMKKESIRKALEAISEVYGIVFNEKDKLKQARFLFSDSLISHPVENQVVFLLDGENRFDRDQFLWPINSRHLNWEDLVERGELPEMVLYPMLTNMGMQKNDQKISKTQLEKKFSLIPKSTLTKAANSNELLIICLFILFVTERFLAYRANL